MSPDPSPTPGSRLPTRKLGASAGLVLFLVLSLLLSLLVLLAWPPGWAEAIRGRLARAASPPDAHVQMMRIFHRRMDPQVPAGSVIFLGDSITQGLVTLTVAPDSINYGIGGQNAVQLRESLSIYESLVRARAIFLLIGINDLAWGDAPGLAGNLERLSNALPPGVPLIWSSILPAYSERVPMKDIVAANADIRRLCQARPGCRYLDTHALFPAGDRSLFPDGIHPSTRAYQLWSAALKAALPPPP